MDHYSKLSNVDVDWDEICQTYSIGDEEYNYLYTSPTNYIKLATNRAKATPSTLPKPVTSYLSFLYRRAMGTEAQVDQLPWTICVLGKRMEDIDNSLRKLANSIPIGIAIIEA